MILEGEWISPTEGIDTSPPHCSNFSGNWGRNGISPPEGSGTKKSERHSLKQGMPFLRYKWSLEKLSGFASLMNSGSNSNSGYSP